MEIGGYLELDKHSGSIYHEEAVALNCGRACLEYLIRAKKITKLYIPYFCCDSVLSPCVRCGIEYEYYHIDQNFHPIFNKALKENEWLYVVNYYGQLTNEEIKGYQEKYKRVIADYAQSFFQMPPSGIDTIYTCRKFFGVSDGGFLYTDKSLGELAQDESYERIHFVLGRFERGAQEFYEEAANNNDIFDHEPMKAMSKLTENLLRSLDYDMICQKRTENFAFLNAQLGEKNELSPTNPVGAYMYPFYIKNGAELRKKLQKEKIYIPTLWPDVFGVCTEKDIEFDYAKNILPIPVDQRYDKETMSYLVERITGLV